MNSKIKVLIKIIGALFFAVGMYLMLYRDVYVWADIGSIILMIIGALLFIKMHSATSQH